MSNVIIIDNDEKRALQFPFLNDGSVFVRTEVRSLHTGDYSIEGYENLITVERKSINDLVNTVIHDWARFAKECRRMATMDAAVIGVEGNLQDVLQHKYESNADPMSVLGKINTIFHRFGIATVFCSDPDSMAYWVHNFFKNYIDER